jgi:hypothetical protein
MKILKLLDSEMFMHLTVYTKFVFPCNEQKYKILCILMFQVVAEQFLYERSQHFAHWGELGLSGFLEGNHLGLSSFRISQQKKYIYFNIYLLKLISNVCYVQLKVQCLGTKSKSRYLIIPIVALVIS